MTPDPLTVTALGADGLGADGEVWAVEHGRTVVVCPSCSFAFDEIHDDGAGCYVCPCLECPSNWGKR